MEKLLFEQTLFADDTEANVSASDTSMRGHTTNTCSLFLYVGQSIYMHYCVYVQGQLLW